MTSIVGTRSLIADPFRGYSLTLALGDHYFITSMSPLQDGLSTWYRTKSSFIGTQMMYGSISISLDVWVITFV